MKVYANHYVNQITQKSPETTKAYSSSTDISVSGALSFDEIAKKYDMKNISPREIDNLYSELISNGQELNQDMFMLSRRGAKFNSHLAKIGAEAVGGVSTYAPDKKQNLLETIQSNIDFNIANNLDTTIFENELKFIRKIDSAATIPSNGLYA